jgi:uncharacterized cupredoxin-like copper-binding protein
VRTPRTGARSDSYRADIKRPAVGAPSRREVGGVVKARTATFARRVAGWCVAALVVALLAAPTAPALVRAEEVVPAVGHALPETSATGKVFLNDTPSFTPKYLAFPENVSLTLTLKNVGPTYAHTFTLAKQAGVVLPVNWTPSEVYAYFAANGSLENQSVAVGATVNVTFTTPSSPGSYEFVSVVPYQFQAGMFGFLNVTSTGPGFLLSENTSNAGGTLSYLPNELAVSPSTYPASLNVSITNLGTFQHTFTVVAQPNVNLTPQNYSAYFVAHPPAVNKSVPGTAGATVWANFSVPAKGVYLYLCTVTGHFAAGMYGYLYVGVPPPPAPPVPSTAVVQEWILAGSAGILGLGLVLAVVATFTGRFGGPPTTKRSH